MRTGRTGAFASALAAAGLLLIAACDSAPEARPGSTAKPEKGAESSPAEARGEKGDGSPDPGGAGKKLSPPTSRAEARQLVGEVIAEPDNFGPAVERGDPYERDPDTWPVLNDDCIWQQQKFPDTVLATLTRRFVVPAADGKGPMQLSAIVTVHRDEHRAEWELAVGLEEGMRCPTQQLSATETLTDLLSAVFSPEDFTEGLATDSVGEQGTYVNEATGAPGFPYAWQQKRLGSVTVTVTGRAAGKGRTEDELSGLMVQAMASMWIRLETELQGGK